MTNKFKKGEIVKIKIELIFNNHIFARVNDRFRITEVNVEDKEMMDYGAINLESGRSRWELGIDENEFKEIK